MGNRYLEKIAELMYPEEKRSLGRDMFSGLGHGAFMGATGAASGAYLGAHIAGQIAQRRNPAMKEIVRAQTHVMGKRLAKPFALGGAAFGGLMGLIAGAEHNARKKTMNKSAATYSVSMPSHLEGNHINFNENEMNRYVQHIRENNTQLNMLRNHTGNVVLYGGLGALVGARLAGGPGAALGGSIGTVGASLFSGPSHKSALKGDGIHKIVGEENFENLSTYDKVS